MRRVNRFMLLSVRQSVLCGDMDSSRLCQKLKCLSYAADVGIQKSNVGLCICNMHYGIL